MEESSETFPNLENLELRISAHFLSLSGSKLQLDRADISGVKCFGSDKLLLHCVYLLLARGDTAHPTFLTLWGLPTLGAPV